MFSHVLSFWVIIYHLFDLFPAIIGFVGVQALAMFEDVAFGRRQVQSINPSGTYNLDCKPDVPPDRISAKSDTDAKAIWN